LEQAEGSVYVTEKHDVARADAAAPGFGDPGGLERGGLLTQDRKSEPVITRLLTLRGRVRLSVASERLGHVNADYGLM